jgi:hypothetical protein
MRPSVVIDEKNARAPSASSLVLNWLSMIGVSIAPGDSVLTRMPRSFNSIAQVRAKERTAALAAA